MVFHSLMNEEFSGGVFWNIFFKKLCLDFSLIFSLNFSGEWGRGVCLFFSFWLGVCGVNMVFTQISPVHVDRKSSV